MFKFRDEIGGLKFNFKNVSMVVVITVLFMLGVIQVGAATGVMRPPGMSAYAESQIDEPSALVQSLICRK